mmetsp:Transcript_11852/g.18205  ORF Transcript_11852/g.18205 Transcript_11852/m.18205 type:complete len:477 (+) Transcript_11852:224-1654(+)|eukprot:CAMPEP_0201737990 /NCGR_PEP_ID=MMETSP0593-20130828/43846_1 /ASSEMBLY_ACC=CAM_ASM_000672 /TAXON_ID=267983 /ORGANISM="Skeletonema japonicum, Strain CCMP2506" /LENGTH=476 /DNA_ID=CAMNT_0048232095 /DNA_START=166 /DNA_END=1596 /DNA_ORIENTATION=+
MGKCQSADVSRREERNENKKHRFLESMARVGSRVFLPESISSPSRRNVYTTLKEHKASTYDHVHELVNDGINERGSGKVGLENLGNTCFMNSSLQCLSNTEPLTDYFLGYDYRGEINHDNILGTKGALVRSYAELTKQLWLGRSESYSPEEFKSSIGQFAPQFEGYEQQDAQELLAFLLDGIHEDLNRVITKPYVEEKDFDGTNDEGDAIISWSNYLLRNKSIVVDLFQGQLKNTMICRNNKIIQADGTHGCGHKNVKFDPFMYLSLPISDDCNSLDDCLSLFCEEETLQGDNQWYCSKCQTHVDATKKIDLWILPPILIVHLKRFKFSVTGYRSKIERQICYPLSDWNLSKKKKSEGGVFPLYDLYAVSHHRGTVTGGHYTAHAKNRFDREWYDFNDSQCRKVDKEKEKLGFGPSAYCLFYNRVERQHDATQAQETTTPIRRQSISRPELWPHLQRDTVTQWKSTRVAFDNASAD